MVTTVRDRFGRRPAAVALVLVGALAGCGESGPAARPGTLVAAISSDPGHLNPAITTAGDVHTAASLLYDGLVELDSAMRPVPGLAARWEVENAGALYRFHLRPGVLWHDGVPFTARDVKFTFDEVLLRYHARTRASLAHVVERIVAQDDSTVEVYLRRPYAPLLQQLNVVEAPILPAHVFEGMDPTRNRANQAPIGTGPYRFASWAPDREIRYTANPTWHGGAPSIGQLILRVIPDGGTRVLALEAGEVDWLFEVPGHERERLEASAGIRVLRTSFNPGGSNCISTVAFNLERPLFGDVRVRRALFHGLDRTQYVERVLFGAGRVASAPIASAIAFAHSADMPLPAFDTAEAARLLESAGWARGPDGIRVSRGVEGVPDGTRLTFDFTTTPTQAPYGELFRAQLRPLGVDVRLAVVEQAVLVETVFTERRFDTVIVSYCNGTDPEIGVRRQYVSSNIRPVPFSNAAAYRNARMDSLFDRASATLDPVERGRIYGHIQALAVRDLPYIWLVETEALRAYRTRCEGFGPAARFAATAHCTP